ncbi:type II secretion system protein [Aureliella helgolandensis]|uniref:Pseudopilin GspJ n=1 Tax=Aureliella helgolandensis TaxID=2527968 RepID=A0A518G302_9BACT|nr:type II secretion system protein [Aureliella helgolandensis]QDV22981.1 hypothetical protein Q31a_12740 [Aureliella helgolandensis]
MPNNDSPRIRRGGFTLVELMLALSLVVVATALIGSLMQMYARNFASRGADIRRQQLARSILTMMADDIRSVVMEQEYDTSVLEQLVGASGGGSATTTGAETSELDSGTAGLDSSSTTTVTSVTSDSDTLGATISTAMPPGIYGDQYSLMIDVSRIPRPDEYTPQQASITDSIIADVPGDMKTVTYYVQEATAQGVDDAMANFSRDVTSASAASLSQGFSSGLVRRQLDRGVIAYAEEMGDTQSLYRTGDLVAPEVLMLEFAYYDGTQWLTEWDSSTQSLPWLIQITLAMQSESGSQTAVLPAGTSVSTLTQTDRETYGINIYELVVAIPGAQLKPADTASLDAASGMSSMGL